MTDTPTLHARLREAILSLDLAPGERLSERGLEPQFGASRTPIRAALMRLESEGLVRRDAKGWTVAPIDLDEISSLAEYREVLETAIARLACDRASDEGLRALAELAPTLEAGSTPEDSLGSGTSFHREVALLSGNEFLASALEGVLTRLYRTRWLEVRSADARTRAAREHEAIVDALLARDSDSAELAVLTHLRDGHRRLMTSLEMNRQMLRARGVSLEGTA